MGASSLQDIKRRIGSVDSTEHITNAMKLVSAAKFRRAKAAFDKAADHIYDITESIHDAFSATGEIPDRYFIGNEEGKKTCYIVITSCRGLCGSFNTNIIKATEQAIAQTGADPMLLIIGSKGRDYFAKTEFEVCAEYIDAPEDITFEDCRSLILPLISRYESGELGKIVVVYTSFKNTLEQEEKMLTLLPFDREYHKPRRIKHPEMNHEGIPVHNAYQLTKPDEDETEEESEEEKRTRMFLSQSMEFEPSVEDICSYLVPKFLEISLYGCVIESATCEHAARRMAMESATDNARDMLSKLSLYYNRARQAAITSEITEIVAGSEAQN